jgi:hypothetical protein
MAINLYLAQTRTTPVSPRGRRSVLERISRDTARPVIARESHLVDNAGRVSGAHSAEYDPARFASAEAVGGESTTERASMASLRRIRRARRSCDTCR